MIFDANTFFGTMAGRRVDYSLETLVQSLKTYGIERALTYSLRGVYYDYSEGNDETLAACRKYPHLVPVATIDPRRYTGCVAEVDKRADQGIKIIRFFPELQGWPLDHLLFEKILAKMAERNLAAMLSCNTGGTASRLMRLARPHGTPIILSDIGYWNLSEALAVLKDYEQAYLETSQLDSPDPVEMVETEIGPGRILFGSRSPDCYPSSPMAVIAYARISAKAKEAGLGGALAGLLDRLGSPGGAVVETAGRFTSREGLEVELTRCRQAPELPASEVKPMFQWPVIDIHAHYGRWPFPTITEGADGILELMRRFGIARCALSSSLAIVYDMREGNRRLREAINGHPELLGYVTVNPNDLEGSREELATYLALPNFIGAKIHPGYSRQPIGSEAMAALLAEVAPYRRPLLMHTWGASEVRALREAAARHRGMPIIMGHMGGDAWAEAIETARTTPNLYLELCCSYPERPKMERAVQRAGSERILFGSDLDLINPGFILGMVRDAAISPEDKERILLRNSQALFASRARPAPQG